MMEADRNGVSSDHIHYESHTERHPFFKKSELMDRLVAQIHERLGGDSTLTEGGTIRLTPLGRLRIRLAMNERML